MQTIDQPAQGVSHGVTGLAAAAELFRALNSHGVSYCHWKSNLRLERSLRGQTDLDLLVAREHEQLFRQLLEERRFKRVYAPIGKRYPSIEDYLGLDPATGTVFHLHVHYELVLGEQFVKNYRLPLEDRFLDSARLYLGVKVPSPELELIVLSLRALLKYRDRDGLKDVLGVRSAGVPARMQDEIRWLLAQTSTERISAVLDDIRDVVPPELVLEFLETIVASPRAGSTLLRLRSRARRMLNRYQRHDRLRAYLEYCWEMWRRRKSFLKFRPPAGMTLPGRGVTIALVGVDGSGKTTLSRELHAWLGQRIDARLYYLGSKQPSPLSQALYLAFRAARRSHRAISRLLGEDNVVSRSAELARLLLLYSHHLSLGHDRYRRYEAGKRAAEAGSVVIFDRFPLEASLDGAQIHLSPGDRHKAARALWSSWERGLYSRFHMPDLLVSLDVSLETAARRKPDHVRDIVEYKNRILHTLLTQLRSAGSPANLAQVDADLPLDGVLSQLKWVAWQALRPLEVTRSHDGR